VVHRLAAGDRVAVAGHQHAALDQQPLGVGQRLVAVGVGGCARRWDKDNAGRRKAAGDERPELAGRVNSQHGQVADLRPALRRQRKSAHRRRLELTDSASNSHRSPGPVADAAMYAVPGG
jgi:hypothetical protein